MAIKIAITPITTSNSTIDGSGIANRLRAAGKNNENLLNDIFRQHPLARLPARSAIHQRRIAPRKLAQCVAVAILSMVVQQRLVRRQLGIARLAHHPLNVHHREKRTKIKIANAPMDSSAVGS
jgi:hypothetical protein